MSTRYQELRRTIANLAAPAKQQVDYLERLFAGHRGYNLEELALEFDAMYSAAGHMRDFGEITQAEIDAAKPLNELLLRWRGQEHAEFWETEALFNDPRWDDLRTHARRALAALPDEERASEWTAKNPTDGRNPPISASPKSKYRGLRIGIGILLVAAVAALIYSIRLGGIVDRPALLRDAKWNDPGSAVEFIRRFRRGTQEAELVSWLEANGFEIDTQAGRASRRVDGLPCAENIEVVWAANSARRLSSAAATVTEAGCL